MKEKYRVTKDGELVPVLTEDGAEVPDPTPMAPPVGFRRQQPLHERIRAMVQAEYLRAREAQEVESPDEADDFDVEDAEDALPMTEYEKYFEAPESRDDMYRRLVEAGWSPPEKKDEAKPARAPSGGAPAAVEEVKPAKEGDAAKA